MALPGINRWANRVALVTGASTGIGAAISRTFVKHGINVVGCARNEERINVLAEELKQLGYPGTLYSFKCDVSKENEVEEMFKWINANLKGVDICVNNAGFTYGDCLLEISATKMRQMMDVNVVALVSCTSKAIKSMKDRDVSDGHIFFLNSMGGHRLTGSRNFYSATKFAVTALTEGFRRELVAANSQIRVTAVSPGLTETEFAGRAFGNKEEGEAFYKQAPAVMQAQDIADIILFTLSAPSNVQVHDVLVRPTGEPR